MKDAFKFDRRTVDRYIEKGQLQDAEYQKHLKSLPDDANNVQYVQLDLYDAEMDEVEKDTTASYDDDSSAEATEET